jgi:hypothetical protein
MIPLQWTRNGKGEKIEQFVDIQTLSKENREQLYIKW